MEQNKEQNNPTVYRHLLVQYCIARQSNSNGMKDLKSHQMLTIICISFWLFWSENSTYNSGILVVHLKCFLFLFLISRKTEGTEGTCSFSPLQLIFCYLFVPAVLIPSLFILLTNNLPATTSFSYHYV